MKVVKSLPDDEQIVSMIERGGVIYVATTKRVLRMRVEEGEEKFSPVSLYLEE